MISIYIRVVQAIYFCAQCVQEHSLQGVSRLTVIYNIQNTQIWVITQEIFFIFHNHRKINFYLKVSEGNLDHILCSKMHNFGIGQFQFLGYQISAKFKK